MSLQFCTLLQRLIDLQRGGGAPSQPAHAHMKICTLNTVKHQKTQTQKHDVQVSCLWQKQSMIKFTAVTSTKNVSRPLVLSWYLPEWQCDTWPNIFPEGLRVLPLLTNCYQPTHETVKLLLLWQAGSEWAAPQIIVRTGTEEIFSELLEGMEVQGKEGNHTGCS